MADENVALPVGGTAVVAHADAAGVVESVRGASATAEASGDDAVFHDEDDVETDDGDGESERFGNDSTVPEPNASS